MFTLAVSFCVCTLDQRNRLDRCRGLDRPRRLHSWDKTVTSKSQLYDLLLRKKEEPCSGRESLGADASWIPGKASLREGCRQLLVLPPVELPVFQGAGDASQGVREMEVTCECLPLIHISIHLKSQLASLKPPLGGHKDEWCHGAVETAL